METTKKSQPITLADKEVQDFLKFIGAEKFSASEPLIIKIENSVVSYSGTYLPTKEVTK